MLYSIIIFHYLPIKNRYVSIDRYAFDGKIHTNKYGARSCIVVTSFTVIQISFQKCLRFGKRLIPIKPFSGG